MCVYIVQIDSVPNISYIGCGISIVFLLLTIMILLVFRCVHNSYTHMNSCMHTSAIYYIAIITPLLTCLLSTTHIAKT